MKPKDIKPADIRGLKFFKSLQDMLDRLHFHYRWHVEIFFRWLKCTLGCKHFVSECENGFALQLYAALIAGLLIVLWTGRKPNKRMLERIQWHLAGWATPDEVFAEADKLKPARA